MTLEEFRRRYPEYDDMSDRELADALHTKFYSDMPRRTFYERVGLDPEAIQREALRGIQTRAIANQQAALPDLAGQTLGTTALTAAGTAFGAATGGPPGAIVGGMIGGAAGNVLGKIGSRLIRGEELPSGPETALDLAVRATGPLASNVGRLTTRAASGLSRRGITETERKLAGKIRSHQTAHEAAEQFPGLQPKVRDAFRRTHEEAIASLKEAYPKEVERAVREAIRRARHRGAAETALPGGIVGGLMNAVEPLTGALIGAGISHAVIRGVLPAMLDSSAGPALARWALRVPRDASKTEIAFGLAAVVTEHNLTGKSREAAEQLLEEFRRQGVRVPSLEQPKEPEWMKRGETSSSRRRRARDPKTGKFVKGGIDHSALEELFGGGL